MSSQTIKYKAGVSSKSILVKFNQNSGASSPGDPLTGLLYNSAGLVAYYSLNGSDTLTAVTLVTLTAGAAYAAGGFLEVSAANAPGHYRFDLPNAILTTPGQHTLVFSGASGMDPHTVFIWVENPYEIGMQMSGTLNGTHSTTTAQLGTNAPLKDVKGFILYLPSHGMAVFVDSYDTATGTVTFSPATTETLANGNEWYLFASPLSSTNSPANVGLTAAAVSAIWAALTADNTTAGSIAEAITTVLTALTVARGEPGQGTPPVSNTLVNKIDMLYKVLINQSTLNKTTGLYSVFNSDGVTVDHKATVADDGTTYSKGGLVTGV